MRGQNDVEMMGTSYDVSFHTKRPVPATEVAYGTNWPSETLIARLNTIVLNLKS